MKNRIIISLILSVFLVVFSLAAVSIGKEYSSEKKNLSSTQTAAKVTENKTDENGRSVPNEIKVLCVSSNAVKSMSVYDYVCGSVSSDISPSYKEEAIKAQAVIAYTYVMWSLENADTNSLSGANLSDSNDCTTYSNSETLKEKWQDKYDIYSEKIASCVDEVFGQYLTYENKVILPYFHALSFGETESAKDLWGMDIAYLKSVTAPGDVLSPDIDSTLTLTKDEFSKNVEALGITQLPSNTKEWFEIKEKDENGFVKTLKIADKTFDKNEIRSAFSLESPYFTLELKDEKFVFYVKGIGAAVGMSQYSADYMARQGSSYEEILRHFFNGIEIEKEIP